MDHTTEQLIISHLNRIFEETSKQGKLVSAIAANQENQKELLSTQSDSINSILKDIAKVKETDIAHSRIIEEYMRNTDILKERVDSISEKIPLVEITKTGDNDDKIIVEAKYGYKKFLTEKVFIALGALITLVGTILEKVGVIDLL